MASQHGQSAQTQAGPDLQNPHGGCFSRSILDGIGHQCVKPQRFSPVRARCTSKMRKTTAGDRPLLGVTRSEIDERQRVIEAPQLSTSGRYRLCRMGGGWTKAAGNGATPNVSTLAHPRQRPPLPPPPHPSCPSRCPSHERKVGVPYFCPILGRLAQLVQSISFTPRGPGVRVPHRPHFIRDGGRNGCASQVMRTVWVKSRTFKCIVVLLTKFVGKL